jgi:M6 family metalloprotease-like protein
MLLAVLVLTVVPIAEANSTPLRREPAKSPVLSGHSPDRSPPHSSVHITKLSGDFRLVVILVEFTDVTHKTAEDQIQRSTVERMNKYWLEVSYGQFNVISDVVGWFQLDHDEAYYGKDENPKDPGSDQRSSELVADACKLARNVDFKQYQSIIVIFAGHGQDSDSKHTDLLWPSAWWDGLDVICGGKTFVNGGFASEVTSYGTLDLGGFTHEFAHTIDLPDLYNTAANAPDYWKTGVDYMGMWSLMASGSWGGPDEEGTDPVGLESWSRIKLGWLSSVSIPMAPEGFVQQLNQLGDTSGPRALKLSATGKIYYLVEARAKTGVDKYLRGSGVLVTRIDESKDTGEGIVRVMDCHRETKSIDDAACKANESWSAPSDNIYMKVIAGQGATYTVAFASKPITTLNLYTAELTLVGVPSSALANVTVDGTPYTTISGTEKLILVFPLGSTHAVTLSQCAIVGEDTRYCTTENTIIIAKEGAYPIHYDTKQYRLLVETQPSSIAGPIEKWFTAGQTETIGPYDETVPVSIGVRYFLPGLTVDNAQLKERTVTLRMDQPHMIKVSYVSQYFLKITSPFGDPKGEGWYAAGDVVTYSVTTPYGILIQHFFVSWTGDATSTESQGTLTMIRPYAIEAKWRDDYTQLWVALVVVAAVAVGFLGLRHRKAKKITPIISVTGVPTSPAIPTKSGWFCIKCGAPLPPDSSFCEICGARQ